MNNVSELLLGPQQSATSSSGIVLALVSIVLAGALLGYLLWCYLREGRIRRRMARRAHQRHGGNIVPPAVVLSETKRLRRKSSGTLPSAHRVKQTLKLRRRGQHPWKHLARESATPH